jgi:U5 small nuclear ribonucleoprotein component
VSFASTDMHWCFTLRSFAQMYAEAYGIHSLFFLALPANTLSGPTEPSFVLDFANRLWGDIYFDPETRKFSRKASDPEAARTFVHFVLSPLYKLYSQVLSEDTESLKSTLDGLGISLKPVMYKMDVRPLLKAVLDQFFGPSTGLVDMIVEHIPSPLEATTEKVTFVHPLDSFFLTRFNPGRTDIYWSSNF